MFDKYKLKNAGIDVEPHEIFLDTLAHQKEEELGITEKRLEVPIKERIAHFLMAIFLILAISLFSKTFFLQIVEGKKLSNIAKNNKGSVTLIIPERGIIYDKNLKKLVSNSPAYDLVCDKRRFITSTPEVLLELDNISKETGVTVEDLKREIEGSSASKILVYENIPHEKLLILEAKINNLTGCEIQRNTIRNYLYGSPFSHLLGYTGRINKNELEDSVGYAVNDYIGKTGLEKSYEEYLRGKTGQLEYIKSAVGVDKGQKIDVEPEPGGNLVLNIDSDLQKIAYTALENGINAVGAKKGAVIAMDPRTGAVLALASYPSYDDNLFSAGISSVDYSKIQDDPYQPLFDRAISAQYPVGSTIKPFLAYGALEEKIISPEKKINDPGYIEIRSKYDPSVVYRFEGVKPHGLVDMREALAVSSNIYFYTIGGGYKDQQGLGPTRIKKYLDLFGWSQKTGIDLPGEFAGFVPTPEWKKKTKNESWWDGDTYNLSIGQSDLQVTPLHIAAAYCAIANGGTLYRPQVVNRVIKDLLTSTQPIYEFKPEAIRSNFLNQESLTVVREGMRDVVAKDYGSAYVLHDLPVSVAAKTGTAETGKAGYFNNWLSAFAPYDNPEIVLVITIEAVKGVRTATQPVAHDILSQYFNR